MKKIPFAFVLLLSLSAFAQKQILDHSDLALWNTIKGSLLAPNGKHVLFSLEKGEKDNYLKVKDINGASVFEYERSSNGMFSYDSDHVFYTIKAWKDSVTAMKSRKAKKKDLPKDSLGILNIKTKELVKIAAVKSYKIPEEWFYTLYYCALSILAKIGIEIDRRYRNHRCSKCWKDHTINITNERLTKDC